MFNPNIRMPEQRRNLSLLMATYAQHAGNPDLAAENRRSG